jgi:hypothetical protein
VERYGLTAFSGMRTIRSCLTCLASESRRQASRAPHQLCAPLPSQYTMPPRNVTQILSNEADIQLAISAIDATQIIYVRRAASTFNVPESTLRDRRARKPARRDCQPNSRKLTLREEEVIIRYILDLDTRRFAPTYAAIRDIADKLLAARSASQVRQK